MQMALYDENLGYYAGRTQRVGRKGDFFTSVSVGKLFGNLLASRFVAYWESVGRPVKWRIIELGANDGALGEDILRELRRKSPEAWGALQYLIIEPIKRLRDIQRLRLEEHSEDLVTVQLIEEIEGSLPGLLFGNEVLDALPFHLLQWSGKKWHELKVGVGSETLFELFSGDPGDALQAKGFGRLKECESSLPAGYQTEVRVNFQNFVSKVASCLNDGLMLFIDYGYAAPEYYDPARVTGTMRTYEAHQAGEDPLVRPGDLDITAHVNFSDLADAAGREGWVPNEFENQAAWLTKLAKPLIMEGGLSSGSDIGQFRTLTHPAGLGARFHAIEFRRTGKIPERVVHRLDLPLG